MDKELKNRSGSLSNEGNKSENRGDRRKKNQPGATNVSNRQTKGRSDNTPAKETGSKKGPNSI